MGLGFLRRASIPVASAAIVLAATATATASLNDVVASAVSNPKVIATVGVQFLLGMALGYVSVKVIKYVLALIGILVLGAALSVWSIGGSVEDFVIGLGVKAQKVMPIVKGALTALGILTVGPITAGFVLGLLIAFIKK